jgi:osmotically inducible protein OsmC
MIRKASAVWHGSGKEGGGYLSTESNSLNKTPYSSKSRFGDGVGTNPEELVAAAHAGCFTMKLSYVLSEAGFEPGALRTSCAITLENGVITNSHLVLVAQVPGISQEQFVTLVKDAELNCPISKSLNTKITVEFTLNS